MKLRIAIILSLLLIAPLNSAQEQSSKARVRRTAATQKNAAAERAWKPFFAAFHTAVKRRDRAALKKMLVRDIYFSGGGGDDNRDGDTRYEAFKFWDEPHTRGWEAFDKTLAKGVAVLPSTSNFVSGKYPSRVAPLAAANRRSIRKGLVDWYAVFEFREDGRWYCTVFNQCCD